MIEVTNTTIRYDDRIKSVYESAHKRNAGKYALTIVDVCYRWEIVLTHIGPEHTMKDVGGRQ